MTLKAYMNTPLNASRILWISKTQKKIVSDPNVLSKKSGANNLIHKSPENINTKLFYILLSGSVAHNQNLNLRMADFNSEMVNILL